MSAIIDHLQALKRKLDFDERRTVHKAELIVSQYGRVLNLIRDKAEEFNEEDVDLMAALLSEIVEEAENHMVFFEEMEDMESDGYEMEEM